MHLLTKEAFAAYQQKVKQQGAILVHISNRHLNLLPVINAAAQAQEQIILALAHQGDRSKGQFDSHWAVLTENERLAEALMQQGWRFAAGGERLLWTDDYSNLIPLLKL